MKTILAFIGATSAVSLSQISLTQQQAALEIKSVGSTLDILKAKIAEADALSKIAQDDGQRKAVLDYLNAIYPAYHDVVHSWDDWFYAGNHPSIPPYMLPRYSWNPDWNVADMMKQEVNDVHKQLSWIDGLEKKLANKDPNKEHQEDFEMLSRLKKDLGLPVNFKTATEKREEQRAADAGWVWTEAGGMPKELHEQLQAIEAAEKKAKESVAPKK